METLGLYIQVPFCASKCSFCNFSSRVAPSSVYDRYCEALFEELRLIPGFYQGAGISPHLLHVPVDSVYMGGGTPSLLGGERISKIVEQLQERFKIVPSAEFTIEVTPGSAGSDFLRNVHGLGINRLSVGAQSFSDKELRSVGRLHSASETGTLIGTARTQGFSNISLDLIAGLPYQTAESWAMSLQTAVTHRPEHMSVYLFEIDEKSRLGNEVLRHGERYHGTMVPDEDFMADAYEEARRFLQGHGYEHYEISNFSHNGFESRHNLKYWQMKPYLGLGAGAHSFDGQSRWANVTEVEEYEVRLERSESPITEHHDSSPEERVEEFFFLGLRQRSGIDMVAAEKRWGPSQIGPWVQKIEFLEKNGWLVREHGCVRLAESALLVSNEIFQEFVGG